MRNNNVAFNTMSMKARLANYIRKTLFEYSTSDFEIKYRGKKKLGEQDKVRIFDEIWAEYKTMDSDLRNYKEKRRYKAKIQKAREERKNLALAK